ncbi:hypothetical protein KFK09_015781 [Dendrobium nobile]|uniref:TF-B3 domain-containing protein n=1 Tax=Dendrobium nobile TaxID=94219 RepID=A0A8T3B6Z1_DENNO|nr:hypothetical protein KFK09_015781 [Dendrobium nobile]
MKDRCWICKKWEEHFYWDHFEESNFHFMKVMNGDFTQKMTIPLPFVSEHLPQKPNGITVYNQSNKKWFVNCSSNRNSFGFSGKSVSTLFQENKIQKGDACVFELKEKRKVVELQMRIVRSKEVFSILTKECF